MGVRGVSALAALALLDICVRTALAQDINKNVCYVRVCFGRSEVPLSRRVHLERGGVRRRGEVNLSQVIDFPGGGEASWRAVAHQAGG